jgi:hypothetical protein
VRASIVRTLLPMTMLETRFAPALGSVLILMSVSVPFRPLLMQTLPSMRSSGVPAGWSA